MKSLIFFFLASFVAQSLYCQTDNLVDWYTKISIDFYLAQPTVEFDENAVQTTTIDGSFVYLNPFRPSFGRGYNVGLSIVRIEKAELYVHFGADFLTWEADPFSYYLNEPPFCADCKVIFDVIRVRTFASIKYPLLETIKWKWYLEPTFGLDFINGKSLRFEGSDILSTNSGFSASRTQTGIPTFIGLSSSIERIFFKRLTLFAKFSLFQRVSGVTTIDMITPSFANHEIGALGPYNLGYGTFCGHLGMSFTIFK